MADQFSASLGSMVLAAFAGGVVLNLMPCVLPVLAIKAMSLARMGHPREARSSALAYTLGVLVMFLTLASVLLVLRASGEKAGWGTHLQSPLIVGLLTLVFGALAVGFLARIEVQFPPGLLPQSLSRKQGLVGEFFAGVLAVVVATPCTAPFMAAAVGFALLAPAAQTLTIFSGLALGFSAPFLLVGCLPHARKLLPKPGAWMETFRQFLAFPMFVATLWLVWLFSRQRGTDGALLLVLGVLCVGGFLWGLRALRHRVLRLAMSLCFLTGSVASLVGALRSPAVAKSTTGSSEWLPFSPALVASLRNQGRTVFVDFTADWCITCKANEKVVIQSESILSAVRDRNIALVKADWTEEDPVITAALEQFGRSGVPLYLVYRPGEADARVLPQILTEAIVLDALR